MTENPRKRLQIEYVPLSILKRWTKNPKDHDLGAIHVSVNDFGFRQPMSVNQQSGELEAGHGRLDVLQQKFDAKESPPEYIDVDPETGEWLVPVQFFDDDETTHMRYAIADNRLVELGGWDYPALVEDLNFLYENATLDATGYDVDDLDKLEKKINPDIGNISLDDAKDSESEKETLTTCPKCNFKF